MQNLYSFTRQYLSEAFEEEKILKHTPRSRVCRVRHIESKRLYICRSYRGSAEPYRRLLHVRCQHLPKIYEAVSDNDQALVLEEFILGDTLFHILKGGALSEKDARNILLQLCDGLYALHSLGLVHRDIKPENILLRGDHAYLIDFDAARASHSENASKNQDTRILGTLGYAPPEQYGFSRTDERADIYAMGVLINEMFTLQHPSAALAPGRWGRIVQRCTMVNPKKRYPSVRALSEMI